MLFRHGHRREARLNLLSRLAWRDMTQHRYRSMVIVMLIALPVIFVTAMGTADDPHRLALRQRQPSGCR